MGIEPAAELNRQLSYTENSRRWFFRNVELFHTTVRAQRALSPSLRQTLENKGKDMLIYTLAAALFLASPINQATASVSAFDQTATRDGQSTEPTIWGNAEVAAYLNTYGPNRNIADIQRTSGLASLFLEFRRNLAVYDATSGFERFSRQVRGVTLRDYLNIKPDDRLRLYEEDVATDSLREVMRSRAMTGEMISFINANYGTDRISAKQTMDELVLMRSRLTEPEDPFVAPPAPAENVLLTFPVLSEGESQRTYWTYDRDARAMTIVASEDSSLAAGEASASESSSQSPLTVRGWSVEEVRNGPPTVRVVGGRQVLVATNYVMGFGQVQQSGAVRQSTSVSDSQTEPGRVYTHTFTIEPEAARALSGALELQVSGKSEPWRDNERTFCTSALYAQEQPAKRVRSCFLTGVIETYRLIDGRDGSVIREWDAR